MPGIVTRNPEELDWEPFDRACYEAASVSGEIRDPVEGATNAVACFADTATAETTPELVARDGDGDPATRERRYFDWGYVCPSATRYREDLLETVAACAEAAPDVRLDEVGFPRRGYCRCDRCADAFAASDFDDRDAWRASVVTDFVADARERVPGDLLLTLYPDPYPGHLYERGGVDLDALEPLVDEFVVPLYDTSYGTTYWLESIASAFADRLDAPLSVELYAAEPDVDALADAFDVARAYADDVLFGYGSGNARAVLRRRDAEDREGVEHRPE